MGDLCGLNLGVVLEFIFIFFWLKFFIRFFLIVRRIEKYDLRLYLRGREFYFMDLCILLMFFITNLFFYVECNNYY